MKRIFINFIGQDNNGFWGGNQFTVNSASDVSVPNHTQNMTSMKPDLLQSDNTLKFEPLKKIISGAEPTPYTPPQIQLPKYDNSQVDKILRYVAPNLTNDDYYPEKTVNPTIATASNKTLGSFPIFSSAALAPAGLWDKRRKAIADYMLDLEKAKSTKEPGLNYQYTPKEGASPWVNVFNQNAIEDLADLQKEGAMVGISMRDVGMLGHPYNPRVNKITNDVTSGLRAITEIDKNVSDIETKGLNLDNRVGSKVAEKIDFYKYLSSLPEDNPIEFGGVTYQGKKGLIRSQEFKDAMHELNASLKVDNDLLSLADNRVKQLEKNSIEEAKIAGYGDNYIQYIKDKIATKYPVKKDENGNVILSSSEQYLDDLATQVMKSRPSYFKETAKNPDLADYTKEDLKDIFSHSLGIERVHAEPIAVTGQGGGAASNTVNAAPQYVKGTLEKLNRGEVIEGKTGKSTIIPGELYTTYITNGKMRVIPNGNIVENAKAIAEAGGADNEYGSVDAPTAITQMNTGKDVETTYGEFEKARPVTSGARFEVPKNGSVQERFNSAIKAMSAKGDKINGLPIAGGTDIYISRLQSTSPDKGDSKFYFELKDKSSNTTSKGVVIPKDKISASIENKNASGWSKFWGSNTEKVFIPKGQDAVILDGAYYQYVPATSKETEGYVIYDKTTNSPYKFPQKNKFEEPQPIKLPVYYVKNIIGTPEKLLNEANSNYKEDKTRPTSTQQTSVSETKTKTGGKGQTMTVEKEKPKTKEERAIEHFMSKGKSKEDAVRLTNQWKTSKKPEQQKAWNEF